MKKKMISVLMAGAMAVSMLAPAAVVSAEDNGDKVKLTFYGWSDEQDYLQPLFDAFRARLLTLSRSTVQLESMRR